PSKKSIALFNLDSDKKVFISSGCDACSNTGYQGRIAIAECIQVDKSLKEMIHNNASENLISDHVFKNNQSIDEASSDLISKGITSCEELIRINNLQENASI
ncbi:MAG: type II/IV secretion system protein, partial [Flavobacteriaceae bacterium]|nr:type II/IV secretion system protein [Flavobacteriaceae bacterium]